MSIEFGILRRGSTITLTGEHRVTLDEGCFAELQLAFSRIQSLTGIEIDMYGGAKLADDDLRIFIAELEGLENQKNDRPLSPDARASVTELIGVARLALETRRELTYFGE